MNFISVKGPELLNMYVGESEKNIREVFERGRANKPCVLFFDEIDALAPARAKNSDQNNVMDRIVAQFMTEMDGLIKADDLILIGSTNRPDLIDPSLLRPGRFDKKIYVGLPKTVEEKIKIFQAQTGKLKLADDLDFVKLSESCPEDYSGADIFAVCSKAFTLSLKEKLRNTDIKKEDIVVSMNHFCEAIKQIQPSLPKSEIMKYEELKLKYANEK
jgi:peroxin-6